MISQVRSTGDAPATSVRQWWHAAATGRSSKRRESVLATRRAVDRRGGIRVESKDEMSKRGIQSPDRADALMIAFATSEIRLVGRLMA